MIPFGEAMRWIEDRPFPSRAGLHARRLARLLADSGLAARGAELPWALVAGSCGKASSSRFLASIVRRRLDAAGVTAPVVLATKPPLRESLDGSRERYQALEAGARAPRWITREELRAHASALAPFAAALARDAPELGPLAPYDLRYAVLWRWALELGASFAVIEANIGLRDDPTSALPPPRVQLLTPIETDHASLLAAPSPLPASVAGLGERAGPVWHKAGGLRAGVPAVVGRQDAPVRRAVAELARERGVTDVTWQGDGYDVRSRSSSFEGSTAEVVVDGHALELDVRVLGGFQVDNAAEAAAAAHVLVSRGDLPPGLAAWEEATVSGVRDARVPGRMDVVAERPTTVLQVGESTAKMRGFVDALHELRRAEPARGPVVACATFLARVHDPWSLVDALAGGPIDVLVATRTAEGGDAADLDPEGVAARARVVAPSLGVVVETDPARAVAVARAEAGERGVVLVVGSGLVAHVDDARFGIDPRTQHRRC